MKKVIVVMAIISTILCAFIAGRQEGISHAMSCAYYSTGGDETDSPDTDWYLYIELDGEMYVNELYVY